MHRTVSAGVSGAGCPRRRQASAMRAGMSPGGSRSGSSGSISRRHGRHVGRLPQQPVERHGDAVLLPGAQRLLQEPQPHDVAQVADRAVHAQLVGEVGAPAGLGEDRLVQLEPDERPRAAGDVGEPVRPARAPPRRPTRCRASRRPTPARASSRRRGAPRPAACPPGCPAPAAAGSSPTSRPRPSQISADHRRVRMSSSPVVEALVTSPTPCAGQPEAHQVGDHQQPLGDLERRRPPGRGELVDGVDRQQLQARSLRTGSRRPGPRPPCPSPRRCGGRGSGPGCRAAGRTGRAARSPPPRSRRRSRRAVPAARAAARMPSTRTGVQREDVPVQRPRRPAPGGWRSGSPPSGPAPRRPAWPSMTRPLEAPRSTATTSAVC